MQNTDFQKVAILTEIYKIGKMDCFIGDEVTSLDYRSNDQIADDVKKKVEVPGNVTTDLINAIHYAGWVDELENNILTEEEIINKIFNIYNEMKNAS